MLLSVFAALTTLGLALWLLGYLQEMPGVAAVGSIIVIGAGATVVLGSLEVEAGQEIAKQYATINNTTVNNATSVQTQYRSVSTPQQLQLGGLITVVGGLLFLRGLGDPGEVE